MAWRKPSWSHAASSARQSCSTRARRGSSAVSRSFTRPSAWIGSARAHCKPAEGPFKGVPTLVKDVFPYPGLRWGMGSRLFAQNMQAPATPYSERIDRSGLVVVGKSATSELGLLGSTETLQEGVTHNPWDLSRSAAGSSGGAAAAVAAGHRAARARERRRRLDPHSGFRVRLVRLQTEPRPHRARNSGRLGFHRLDQRSLRHALGARQCACSYPSPRRRAVHCQPSATCAKRARSASRIATFTRTAHGR